MAWADVFVAEDNFSSFLGLAGPAHFCGGAATVEGNSASDPILDHCLPQQVAKRGERISGKGWEPKVWMQDGGSYGHLPGRTGSGRVTSQSPSTYYVLDTVPGAGDAAVNKADKIPCPQGPTFSWWKERVSQLRQSHQTQVCYLQLASPGSSTSCTFSPHLISSAS